MQYVLSSKKSLRREYSYIYPNKIALRNKPLSITLTDIYIRGKGLKLPSSIIVDISYWNYDYTYGYFIPGFNLNDMVHTFKVSLLAFDKDTYVLRLPVPPIRFTPENNLPLCVIDFMTDTGYDLLQFSPSVEWKINLLIT